MTGYIGTLQGSPMTAIFPRNCDTLVKEQ
jgi:hypothetical protein